MANYAYLITLVSESFNSGPYYNVYYTTGSNYITAISGSPAYLPNIGNTAVVIIPTGSTGLRLNNKIGGDCELCDNNVDISLGGGGGTPTTTDLKLWLKPENLTFSAGRVSGWTDASPNSVTITVPGGNEPYQSTTYLNGYTGSRFDGNSSLTYLNYSVDLWDTGSGTNASTVIAVWYPETSTALNYGSIISQGGGGRTSVAVCPQAYPDNTVRWATDNYAAGGKKTDGNSAINNWYAVTWTWSDYQTPSTTNIYLSNTIQASSVWGAAPNPIASGNRYIGNFKDSSADACPDGTLVELLVYRRVLTSGELSTIQSYFNTKYGI